MFIESLRIVPSALRLFVVPMAPDGLRRLPSALRSLDMPPAVPPVPVLLLFIESLRIVPSALRLFIVPDVLVLPVFPAVPPAPIVPRLVLGEALSRFGTVVELLLVEFWPVGVPAVLGCAKTVAATKPSEAASVMPRMLKWFMG